MCSDPATYFENTRRRPSPFLEVCESLLQTINSVLMMEHMLQSEEVHTCTDISGNLFSLNCFALVLALVLAYLIFIFYVLPSWVSAT